jgi:hypothetical protein
MLRMVMPSYARALKNNHLVTIAFPFLETNILRARRFVMYALSEGRLMLENGKYSAWFRTPLGEGTGVVCSKIARSQAVIRSLLISGHAVGDEFTADISTKRHAPGQLSVFGIDKIDLKLTGKSTGTMATCRGTSRQAPGMTFEATIIRISE